MEMDEQIVKSIQTKENTEPIKANINVNINVNLKGIRSKGSVVNGVTPSVQTVDETKLLPHKHYNWQTIRTNSYFTSQAN